MSAFYSSLLTPQSDFVREERTTYKSLSERHLQILWFEQKFFKELKTREGKPIQILSPGIWNTQAGPDFVRAHVKIGAIDYRGDIEIHLTDKHWISHKHFEDPRYNKVMLHLSLWQTREDYPVIKQDGSFLHQAYLENFLTASESKILHDLDTELYPFTKCKGTGQCAQLFEELDSEKTKNIFQSAAIWRLEKKYSFLLHQTRDPLHQIGAGIAAALGYQNNSAQFLEIFTYLLEYKDHPIQEIFAIALGICGFFESKYQKKWSNSPYYQELNYLWQAASSQINHQSQLDLFQIRPLNHPIRRLFYLSNFIGNYKPYFLNGSVLQLWNKRKNDPKSLLKKLLDLIPDYTDPYWNTHYTFEVGTAPNFLSLLGENLKIEILVNVILPFLTYNIQLKNEKNEWEAFEKFYKIIPNKENSKAKYLESRFFGDGSNEQLMNRAVFAQGAFQIHRDFCNLYEASCSGCPFIDRVKTALNTF